MSLFFFLCRSLSATTDRVCIGPLVNFESMDCQALQGSWSVSGWPPLSPESLGLHLFFDTQSCTEDEPRIALQTASPARCSTKRVLRHSDFFLFYFIFFHISYSKATGKRGRGRRNEKRIRKKKITITTTKGPPETKRILDDDTFFLAQVCPMLLRI